MAFTNLEKYVYSKKCLKQRRQSPPPHPTSTPPSIKVEGIFAPKKSVQPPKWSRPRNDPQPWNDPQIDPEMIPN